MSFALEHRSAFRFALLCAGYFLFSFSFNMPIPMFPAYLASLGGARYLGLIISLFTLTAGLSRPLSGKLADTVGRRPVMIFGSVVCLIASLLYPILASVAGFLLLRLFHGLSTGFNPTGSSAYVADLIPPERRGQALGTLGLCSTLGLALGPALGSAVAEAHGIKAMFYCSGAAALVSVCLLAALPETLQAPGKLRWQFLYVPWKELFEPRVLAPAWVTFLLYASYGTALTLAPAVSLQSGLGNAGLFFTCYTAGSVGIRILWGKAPDRYGRIPVLKAASGLMLGAQVMIALASSTGWLLSAAALYGLSMGLMTPAGLAWTIDLAQPQHRGRALSTMYIAMEAGIGLGALGSGWWYQVSGHDIRPVFFGMAVLALISVLYLYFGKPPRSAPQFAAEHGVASIASHNQAAR
jgi:MFS family permease